MKAEKTMSMRAEKQTWDLAVSRIRVTFMRAAVVEGREGTQTQNSELAEEQAGGDELGRLRSNNL